MAGKAKEDWIQTFDKYLASALDPKSKEELREQYKIWIKNKGKLYSDLQAFWPELIDLLHSIEKNIGIQVELKQEKETKETVKGKKDESI